MYNDTRSHERQTRVSLLHTVSDVFFCLTIQRQEISKTTSDGFITLAACTG